MIQQINLYQPSVLEKKQPLSPSMLLGFFSLGVVLLAGYYAFVAWQTAGIESRLQAMEGRQSALLAQLTALQQVPAGQKSPLLQREVDTLTQSLAAKQPLLELFKTPADKGNTGFSPYLEGLSRRTPSDLWLSRIVIAPAPGRSALEGSALEAETVPVFLQALREEPAFSGMSFANFTLSRQESGSRYIDFMLETRKESSP